MKERKRNKQKTIQNKQTQTNKQTNEQKGRAPPPAGDVADNTGQAKETTPVHVASRYPTPTDSSIGNHFCDTAHTYMHTYIYVPSVMVVGGVAST